MTFDFDSLNSLAFIRSSFGFDFYHRHIGRTGVPPRHMMNSGSDKSGRIREHHRQGIRFVQGDRRGARISLRDANHAQRLKAGKLQVCRQNPSVQGS
jgi:hypothetical protein